MTFTVGETVVYPNHGAAVIEDIEMRTIKGRTVSTSSFGSSPNRTSWSACPR